MSTDIDSLLARARLVPTAPYTLADVGAAELRVAARVAARGTEYGAESGAGAAGYSAPEFRAVPDPAARDLRTLCETFLMSPRGLEPLRSFLTSALPEPPGARALGGILYLAGCEDSARFWWQYAAGASDTVSSYCLYLHHRSMGEEPEADLWLDHSVITPATLSPEATELEIATALHVLSAMRHNGSLPEPLRALVEYVPALVGFVDDDLDLALPDGDLPGAIRQIIARGTPGGRPTHPPGQTPPQRRSPDRSRARTEPASGNEPDWSQEIQDALRDCADTVSC